MDRPSVEEVLEEWAGGGAYGESSHFIREFSKTALAYIESLKDDQLRPSDIPTKEQVLTYIPKSLPKGTPDLRHAQDTLKRVRQVILSQLRKEEMEILFGAVIRAWAKE